MDVIRNEKIKAYNSYKWNVLTYIPLLKITSDPIICKNKSTTVSVIQYLVDNFVEIE